MDSPLIIPIIKEVEEVEGFGDYYYFPDDDFSLFNYTNSDYEFEFEHLKLCEIARPMDETAQALTTVGSVAGIVLNCVVIHVMFCLNEHKKTGIHWLIKHVFISNVVFLLFLLFQMINEHHGKWVMGTGMCKLGEASAFTSHSAGVVLLAVANLFGIASSLNLPLHRIPFPSLKCEKLNCILKYVLAVVCIWLPCAMVNLPLYKYKHVNDCQRCVLEFPIDIGELCPMLGLNSSSCVDIMDFFTEENATVEYMDADFFNYSGDDFDTNEFGKMLESNITKMAEMTACRYEEPRSFFVWLFASFALFYAAPIPILSMFGLLWLFDVALRTNTKSKHQIEQPIMRVIFAIDVLYFVFWTPWNIIHLKKAYGGLGMNGHQCASLLHYSRLSALLFNALAPVIYACMTTDFRTRLLRVISSSTSFCYDLLNPREKSVSKSGDGDIGAMTSSSDGLYEQESKESSVLTENCKSSGYMEAVATPV